MRAVQVKISFFVSVFGDAYSNSFISPNSAGELEGSELPSELPVDVTSGPNEIVATRPASASALHTNYPETFRRSDEPLPPSSSMGGIDELLSSKNVGESLDSNDVELSGKVVRFIQPSRTISERNEEKEKMRTSGEALGTPQV